MSTWASRPKLTLEHPLLQVEVLTAPQADALGMVRSGRADLALVFGRSGAAPYQAFREVAEERLLAVAGRDTGQVDQRIAMSSLQWKTDRPIAALALVKAGLGGAWLPSSQVREAVQGGDLVEIRMANHQRAALLRRHRMDRRTAAGHGGNALHRTAERAENVNDRAGTGRARDGVGSARMFAQQWEDRCARALWQPRLPRRITQ